MLEDNDMANIEDPGLPQKSLFRVDEVASYFDVNRSTIYLWMDHGILGYEQYGGTKRIPRKAILECRFRNKKDPLL